jgi:hypothetical protein
VRAGSSGRRGRADHEVAAIELDQQPADVPTGWSLALDGSLEHAPAGHGNARELRLAPLLQDGDVLRQAVSETLPAILLLLAFALAGGIAALALGPAGPDRRFAIADVGVARAVLVYDLGDPAGQVIHVVGFQVVRWRYLEVRSAAVLILAMSNELRSYFTKSSGSKSPCYSRNPLLLFYAFLHGNAARTSDTRSSEALLPIQIANEMVHLANGI